MTTIAILRPATDPLLRCGLYSAILFPLSSFAQAFTREGFDLRRHGLSNLALGDLGWIQTLTFIASGILTVLFAAGLHRTLAAGPGSRLGPWLIGGYGVGMIGGGIFHPDPELGFPAGAPVGVPDQLSASATLHVVFAVIAFHALILATCVFARRFHRQGRRSLSRASLTTGLAIFAITSPLWGTDTASVRLAIGVILISTWLSLITAASRSS